MWLPPAGPGWREPRRWGRPALAPGRVLPAGAKPRSVTLNGTKVPSHLVATPRGTAVEVPVKAPAAQETLAVQTAG